MVAARAAGAIMRRVTPLDDLKAAVLDAAGELRNGGGAGDRMSLERP